MTRPETRIRPADRRDVRQLLTAFEWLMESPGTRPARWSEKSAAVALRHAMESDTSVVLVAEQNKRIVGFCTVYEDLESIRFGRRAWVEDLAVHPGYRSRGIGRNLLSSAKSWARKAGASHLGLECGEARVDAQRFYERERPAARSKSFAWDLRGPTEGEAVPSAKG